MPDRDLHGEEIPVGKVTRSLRYDGLAAESSPDWLTRFGAATERKGDVATSRGELHLDIDGVGGFDLPRFDPNSFRELALRVAVRHRLDDESVAHVGFADADGAEDPSGWCYYRETGDTDWASEGSETRGPGVSSGRVWFGRDGEGSETGNVGIAFDASDGCSVLEVRVRPFEDGATVCFGGSDRGGVAFEDSGRPFGFDGPVRPKILVDASGARPDEAHADGEESTPARLSLASVELTVRHN